MAQACPQPRLTPLPPPLLWTPPPDDQTFTDPVSHVASPQTRCLQPPCPGSDRVPPPTFPCGLGPLCPLSPLTFTICSPLSGRRSRHLETQRSPVDSPLRRKAKGERPQEAQEVQEESGLSTWAAGMGSQVTDLPLHWSRSPGNFPTMSDQDLRTPVGQGPRSGLSCPVPAPSCPPSPDPILAVRPASPAVPTPDPGPSVTATLISGGVPGLLGATRVFPIDLAEARLQNQRGQESYTGTYVGGRGCIGVRGPAGQGAAVNLTAVTPEKAVKLAASDVQQQLLEVGCIALFSGRSLTAAHGARWDLKLEMLAGYGAGLRQAAVICPLETPKIPLQRAGRLGLQITQKIYGDSCVPKYKSRETMQISLEMVEEWKKDQNHSFNRRIRNWRRRGSVLPQFPIKKAGQAVAVPLGSSLSSRDILLDNIDPRESSLEPRTDVLKLRQPSALGRAGPEGLPSLPAARHQGSAASPALRGPLSPGRRPAAALIARELLRTQGLVGLYWGLGAALLRDIPFSVIYFPLFAKLNLLGVREPTGKASFAHSFTSGCVAGPVTPLEAEEVLNFVLKTIQTLKKGRGEDSYSGLTDCAR
ncbi:LOW QUALITY PROTEIN: mitochondrial glutamate carrier 2 [Megaptera novaeangliae]